MSETIKILFTDILDCQSGNSKLTKQYMNEHIGEYPVYSAKTIGETKAGDIDSYMFDIEGLQLTTNGANAGTWIYREKHKYSLNGDARLYYPKKEYKDFLDLVYLKYALQQAFKAKGFDWNTKATKNNIQDISINVPVTPDGIFDLTAQKEFAKQYQNIEMQKDILLNKIEELKRSKISFDADEAIHYQEIPITRLFTPKGGDMKLSKPYCEEHGGTYPVYSGSTTRDIFGSIDNYKYDGEFLTWVIDGLAGYVIKLNGQFSITCHRGILIPTEECKNIDLLYVKYMIEPIFRKRARGRIGINGKNEYTALKPTHIVNYNDSIPIPIDANGKFDLEKQKDLARQYATIETIKENIYKQIRDLTAIVVE